MLANLLPQSGYLHGARPCSANAAIYGFIANILFYPIETPLKQFVTAQDNLVRHCRAVHAVIG
ncbi:MAG TPA: glutathione S-transferase C-terminal domain-containing protein [Dongiaceae bacterium]|nr:glutathione S-transferase C-terminal domain-containing protein [Dongiaceae bacterium]